MLTISDGANIRIRLGNYKGEFVFIIYDKKNNQAVYLNENGEAVFSGSVDTKKDATIGSCLYLQTTELVGNIQQPAIRFKNKDGEVIFEISVTEDGCLRFIPILGTGKVLLGNTEAASKDDIQKLQSDIKGLADRISALEKA